MRPWTPTDAEMEAWEDATREILGTDRAEDEILHAAELTFVVRMRRLRRLIELDAPLFVIEREKQLVSWAVATLVGIEPTEFSLPVYSAEEM